MGHRLHSQPAEGDYTECGLSMSMTGQGFLLTGAEAVGFKDFSASALVGFGLCMTCILMCTNLTNTELSTKVYLYCCNTRLQRR